MDDFGAFGDDSVGNDASRMRWEADDEQITVRSRQLNLQRSKQASREDIHLLQLL